MKKVVFIFILLLQFSYANKNANANLWGFYAHKRINRMAVFTLPPEMFSFYKKHIEFITEHAVDPDKRRYATKNEAPRHYIDIDHYVHHGEDPFDIVPKKWMDAVDKFSEDTLQAYGIVPWHIPVMSSKLTKAFQDNDLNLILKYSSEIGHYIGDAHVPLHTTENYNGQLTNQKGIHGFWESRIPELSAEDYDYFVGKAQYQDDILAFSWNAVKESHMAVDSVLAFERELTTEFDADKKYVYEQRGRTTIKTYSKEFSAAYENKLGGMIERRLRTTIIGVGSIWYTCWVNAGKPDLDKIINQKVSEEFLKQIEEENSAFGKENIKGREHDH